MTGQLLQRQNSLLSYLTSCSTIFGDQRTAPIDPHIAPLDVGLLHLEAKFSYEKRREKIASILARTFELLNDENSLMREFVEACPPAYMSRFENARQFHVFICGRSVRQPVQV